MKMYGKIVLKYFDYSQYYIWKDIIYHQSFFKLSIPLYGKKYLKSLSEYICLDI